jgi:hypothetical protein
MIPTGSSISSMMAAKERNFEVGAVECSDLAVVSGQIPKRDKMPDHSLWSRGSPTSQETAEFRVVQFISNFISIGFDRAATA